eukprot:CAMPEP_0196576740 /NCGR_PEP_ID=MMETSP1081-20130531/5929_1 /TAXON_ID=36882 /ORGANISM="Pyramimonas amylifera, Strain CCMP720" /LENGTH=211 /DNA_ID=CAMNT_0041895429 /DNA_START=170 /DNA_END=805 /DNA_ORIENTATION=-
MPTSSAMLDAPSYDISPTTSLPTHATSAITSATLPAQRERPRAGSQPGCAWRAGEDFLVAAGVGTFIGALQCAMQPVPLAIKVRHTLQSGVSLGLLTGGWTLLSCVATKIPGYNKDEDTNPAQASAPESPGTMFKINDHSDDFEINMDWDFSAWDLKDKSGGPESDNIYYPRREFLTQIEFDPYLDNSLNIPETFIVEYDSSTSDYVNSTI